MKAKSRPRTGPQRYVLTFSSTKADERRSAIAALRAKIETLTPQPAVTVGTDVFDGHWILTLRDGQTTNDLGKAIDPFSCQSVAEFEASLVAEKGVGQDEQMFPDEKMVR